MNGACANVNGDWSASLWRRWRPFYDDSDCYDDDVDVGLTTTMMRVSLITCSYNRYKWFTAVLWTITSEMRMIMVQKICACCRGWSLASWNVMSRVRWRDAVKRRYSIAVKGNYSSGTKILKEKFPARGFPFYNLKFFCKEDKDLVRGSLRGEGKGGTICR